MAEPAMKKRKVESGLRDSNITDPRFANIQSDPRYRLPGRKNKVKLDKRFSRALKDEDFSRKAKVDRYGRPLESNAERKRLKRKYEFEDEEDKSSDEADDDDEVQKELQRFGKKYDPLREGKDVDSSSSEESSDDDSDLEEEAELAGEEQPDVPMGEVTSRIAVVNLDWDNIRAEDLFTVFSSETFLGSAGRLVKVSIYPSEFGKERMQREEMEGPPKEIFASQTVDNGQNSSEDEEDDEDIKKSILQPDEGADFDSQALRQYQLDRLRYFYAVLTFSSPEAAKKMYDAVDGTEYLSTANFFDLRFVPDDTDFSSDAPREECESIPVGYKPNDFVTDALQHSKVRLTWDAEDAGRKEAAARAFKGGRKEIDENDLKAYIGTDSSDPEDDDNNEAEAETRGSKKETERQRMRALLGLGAEKEKSSKKKDSAPVGGIQVTFSAGLSGPASDAQHKRSVFENSPEPEETTVEKYVRKEKERKQRRKDRMKGARDGHDPDTAENTTNLDEEKVHNSGSENEGQGDLGFDDPFFTQPSNNQSTTTKIRKEERLKRRQEREAEEAAERKQRAELELLMADDNNGRDDKTKGMRHFDMKEIEKQEKEARRKNKKKLKKTKDSIDNEKGGDDGFRVDTSDPRFARLFESHEYAIDPTNPRYKGTKGMEKLLEEGRNRRSAEMKDAGGVSEKKSVKKDGKKEQSEVLQLVEKIRKRKA